MLMLYQSIVWSKLFAKMIMIKFSKFVILFSIISLVLVNDGVSTERDEDDLVHSQQVADIRQSFRLPQMFNFEDFKQLFNKHYDSIVEELLRKKYYLGRAFKAFISSVCYKYNKAKSYLAINQMSDWTPYEVDDLYLRITDDDWRNYQSINVIRPKEISNLRNMIPKVSLEDLENELVEIERHKDEIGYKEIYEELARAIEIKKKTEKNGRDSDKSDNDKPEDASSDLIIGKDDLDKVEATTGGSFGVSFLRFVITTAIDVFRRQDGANNSQRRSNIRRGIFYKDYRTSDCYLPPKDQGKCGSCYAFASVAMYEFLFCQTTGVRANFSEQYVVDCGEAVQLKGCKGGKFVRVSDFFQEFGLELQQTYPYVGKKNECPYTADDPEDKRGYLKLDGYYFDAFPEVFFETYLDRGPFIMNIMINEEFYQYGGGVDQMIGCWESNLRFHSVVVIGSGIEDAEDFWLIRNSFGTKWGEGGHYKLTKDTRCIINNYGYVPNITFKENYEDNLNQKYEPETLVNRIQRRNSLWNKLKKASIGILL